MSEENEPDESEPLSQRDLLLTKAEKLEAIASLRYCIEHDHDEDALGWLSTLQHSYYVDAVRRLNILRQGLL